VVAALSDLPHKKRFGFFSSLESQVREVVGAFFESSESNGVGRREGEDQKFNGSDFRFWKMQIDNYLYQKKLYMPLIRHKPSDMEQA